MRQTSASGGATYDCESGERHSGNKRTDEQMEKPPKWFLDYMEKFKSDLTEEITERVTKKTVKRLSHSLPELTDKKRKEKNKDETKKTSKTTESTSHDAICDVCDGAIVGVRYKCGNCSDFDLCDKCESDDVDHDPDHVFLKLVRPATFPWKRKGRTIPLLNRSVYQADVFRELRHYGKLPVVDSMDLAEKFGRRHHHEKRTEKLKRRHDVQRDAPYKREKLALGARLRALENADMLKTSTVAEFSGSFVRDESIPDETHLQPDTKFVKKWIMKNSGTATWDDSVKLQLLWGSLKCDTTSAPVPALVPDEEGTVLVEMQAPAEPGRYQNHWSLVQNNVLFGHKIWCSIIVDQKEVLEAKNSLEIVDKTEYEVVEGNTETNEESGEVDIVARKDTDDPDEPLSYEIVKNEEDLLKVPQKASQTTTPNNTPLVSNPSTPPRSPAPELELAARKLGSACGLEALTERRESQDGTALAVQEKMAELSLKDLSLDTESDSDTDYYVVPLPQCFDTSTPLTRSTVDQPREYTDEECCSERSFDLISSEDSPDPECKETALRLGYDLGENQPEIELQDLSERRQDASIEIIDETMSSRATVLLEPAIFEPVSERVEETFEISPVASLQSGDLVSERGEDTVAVVTERVERVEEREVEREVVTDIVEEEVVTAPVLQEIHPIGVSVELPDDEPEEDPNQTMVKQPIETVYSEERDTTEISSLEGDVRSDQTQVTPAQAQSPTQSHRSSPGLEDFMNAAFEVAGSAASQAIHAAKDVVSMLKMRSQYAPQQSNWTPPQQQYIPAQQRWTPSGDLDQYSDISDDENVYPVRREATPREATPREATPMETLIEMGFANRSVNERLLQLHDNDINKVVTEILSTEGEWYNERH